MTLYLALPVLLLVFAAGLAVLVYSLGSSGRYCVPDTERLQAFSASRYRPMVRMLSDQDYSWLENQHMDRSVVQRLRAERRDVFRTYLDNLVRDFEELHSAARTLLFASDTDRPELAERLVRIRFDFNRSVLAVRVRLALPAFIPQNIEVSNLVAAIDSVHSDFRTLVAVRGISAA